MQLCEPCLLHVGWVVFNQSQFNLWCFCSFSVCLCLCACLCDTQVCFNRTHPTPFSLLYVVNGRNRCIRACDRAWNPARFICLCFWQRSTSLEVSVTARDCASDVQSSRRSPSSACARRKRRSQSIPADLAAPSADPYTQRQAGRTPGPEEGAASEVILHQNIIPPVEAPVSDTKEMITVRWKLSTYDCHVTCQTQLHKNEYITLKLTSSRGCVSV